MLFLHNRLNGKVECLQQTDTYNGNNTEQDLCILPMTLTASEVHASISFWQPSIQLPKMRKQENVEEWRERIVLLLLFDSNKNKDIY